MIVRDRRKVRPVKITAYDFEWHPDTLQVTVCGAYDERGYRHYSGVDHFLLGELTPENSGRRFYAHFGGASDMVFLLRPFLKDSRYQVRGIFSGSSAILVRITRGDLRWDFCDSYWTMKTPLREIGKWLGGGDWDKGRVDFRSATLSQLREYNCQDNRILFEALCRFQDLIISKGGKLGITAASTAMNLFLRRFLKRPIQNGARAGAISLNDWVRGAYCASRVENIRLSCDDAYAWDINSSFPYSMTGPVPGSPLPRVGGATLPDKGLWCADVTVNVGEQYLPPLPMRGPDGRVFFPTGRFRTRIMSDDMACGDFDIEKVHGFVRFEERDDLKDFAEEFYQLRLQSEGFDAPVWKIVLNSLYGKFAEQGLKEVLLVNPLERDVEKQVMLAPGIYIGEENVDIPHEHVPISACITARSRWNLRQYMLRATREHPRGWVYNCDTDGFVCDATFEQGKALGDLKNDYVVKRGTFAGSKLYAVDIVKNGEERTLVKAKGFSRKVSEGGIAEPLTYQDFVELHEGATVRVQRFKRLRELIRSQGADYEPQQITMNKRLNKALKPKRAPVAGGPDTRPWEVGELLGD